MREVLFKIWWSFNYGGDSGWTLVPVAIVGLVVFNAAVLWAMGRRRAEGPDRPANPNP